MPERAEKEGKSHYRRSAHRRIGRHTGARDERRQHEKGSKARKQAFAEIEHEHRGATLLAHGAHGVGGPDVATAVLANVGMEHRLRDDDSPGNRPQKEADNSKQHEREQNKLLSKQRSGKRQSRPKQGSPRTRSSGATRAAIKANRNDTDNGDCRRQPRATSLVLLLEFEADGRAL